MTDVLVTRDGLIGNSPRYTGHTSPPYQRFLKDDAGNAINLTGVLPSAFTITLVNQSNPLFVKSGAGTFSVPSGTAAQGLVSYQYSSGDVADAGNWYAFWTVQLSDEPAPRVFDPDFLSIILFPSASGGGISVTVQDVNLTEVNGTAVSSSNPVPTSGPVTAIDGGIATLGNTSDTSSVNTTIGLLKAIKAYLGATLTTSLTGTLPAGTNVIGHVVVDSAGSVNVTSLPSIPAGTNVIGHIIVDSGAITANAGTNLNTSLLALETGGNLASAKAGLDVIKTYTSAFADTSASGTVTNDNDVTSIALPGGQATALIQITGTFSGTLTFEVSADSATTWNAIQASQLGSNPTTIATSTTTTGMWRANVSGFTNFHVKLHPVVSGTASIIIRLSQGVHNVTVNNSTSLGPNTKANSASVTIASDQSSVASPLISQQQTEAACEAAQAFIATTGSKTSTVAAQQALSVFNPSGSGKTLRVKRILGVYGVTANGHPDFQLTYQTTDPALNTAVTAQNMSLGGAASVANITQTAVGTGVSITGTMLMEQDTSSDNAGELLAQGFFYKVPPGTGLTLYFNAANTSTYALNFQWLEF